MRVWFADSAPALSVCAPIAMEPEHCARLSASLLKFVALSAVIVLRPLSKLIGGRSAKMAPRLAQMGAGAGAFSGLRVAAAGMLRLTSSLRVLVALVRVTLVRPRVSSLPPSAQDQSKEAIPIDLAARLLRIVDLDHSTCRA